METVAFWRRYLPAMTVGGWSPDGLAEEIARLEPLAQAVAEARTQAKTVKQAELAAFERIRSLNLNVPLLIAGRFDEGHPVRVALAAVYAVTPETDELNLLRARRLIPVWRKADAALAARKPGDAIVRDEAGVAEFETWVTDYPKTLQATVEAVTAFRAARTALRSQHDRVDQLNKRAYKKFKAEAYTDPALRSALQTAITREKSSGSRRRQ